MKRKPIFITGIGTSVGKTVTSAILVEKLQADYWKPIQSGDLHDTDTDRVRGLVTNQVSVFHPESYRLTQPFSPHKAAALDKVSIDMENILLPQTDNLLIIEGAGGLMVPLNEKDLMIDLIKKFDAEVVLVSKNYLGSINHTILSAEILKSRNIDLCKIIFCGEEDESSEKIISQHLDITILQFPLFESLDKNEILNFSANLIL
ncbi:MAG: dethiobiotin synthase [Daejeonella sp.]